jgi:hypothetical protein
LLCFDAAFTCCPIGEIPSPVQCALRDARDVVEVLTTRLRDRGTGYCTPWPSPVAGRRAAMPYCTSPRGTITIKVWTGVTTGRDRNVGGENLIVDGHTGISVEYGHHCTTSEHVTTLSRPHHSQYDRYLTRTELEIERYLKSCLARCCCWTSTAHQHDDSGVPTLDHPEFSSGHSTT